MSIHRCTWAERSTDLDKHYHDTEWGVPVRDDRTLFEFLILEGAQAGLSWTTVLKKRENYRAAFDNFEAEKIIHYDPARITGLLQNPGIVRNKLKINSVIINAQLYLEVQQEVGSFSDYIWQFVDGQPIVNRWADISQVPATTPQSDAMSKALKKRGFKFVGSTICYAYMQACGLVNDHETNCFRWSEV